MNLSHCKCKELTCAPGLAGAMISMISGLLSSLGSAAGAGAGAAAHRAVSARARIREDHLIVDV